MDRGSSTAYQTEIVKDQNKPFHLLEVYLDSGTQYLTDGYISVSFNSNTYTPLGHFLNFSNIVETNELTVDQLSISLSGVEQTYTNLLLKDYFKFPLESKNLRRFRKIIYLPLSLSNILFVILNAPLILFEYFLKILIKYFLKILIKFKIPAIINKIFVLLFNENSKKKSKKNILKVLNLISKSLNLISKSLKTNFLIYTKLSNYFFSIFIYNMKILDYLFVIEPDVIHANDLLTLPIAGIYKLLTGTSFIYDSHELEMHRNATRLPTTDTPRCTTCGPITLAGAAAGVTWTGLLANALARLVAAGPCSRAVRGMTDAQNRNARYEKKDPGICRYIPVFYHAGIYPSKYSGAM